MDQMERYLQEKRNELGQRFGTIDFDQAASEREKKIAFFTEKLEKFRCDFAKLDVESSASNNIQENELTRIYVKANLSESLLISYFKSYGEISDIYQPTDNDGKSRGFTYITFSKVYKDLMANKHVINGCEIVVDRDAYPPMSEERSPALMISGPIQNLPSYMLQSHFSQFGKIIEIFRKFDFVSKTFLRYAFILYSSSEAVEKAIAQPFQTVGDQLVNLRKAANFEVHRKLVTDESLEKSITLHEDMISKFRIIPLSENLTLDVLKNYFNGFGRVLDYYIPKVYGSNENKNYAYFTLTKTEDKPFVKQGWHTIAGSEVKIELEKSNNGKAKSNCIVVSASPRLIGKISEIDLRNHFKKYGRIKEVRKPKDTIKKTMLHCAFIEFKSTNDVDKAIQQPVCIINNLPFSVSKSTHEQYERH